MNHLLEEVGKVATCTKNVNTPTLVTLLTGASLAFETMIRKSDLLYDYNGILISLSFAFVTSTLHEHELGFVAWILTFPIFLGFVLVTFFWVNDVVTSL